MLKLLTPQNLSSEKAKFFESEDYNPQFIYSWESESVKFREKNNLKAGLINAIITQETELITNLAQEYFETDLEKFRQEAETIVNNKPQNLPEQTIADFQNAFQDGFDTLGLSDYRLELTDETGFNFRPVPRLKKIVMSTVADTQFFSAEGEARHELVHVVRFENGKFNKLPKSENYLPTEEGLATYVHDSSLHGESSRYQHATEYLAAGVAVNGSLRDVYNYFLSVGFNPELAWQRAIRHKFGFKDTSLPGGIIKPAMYFAKSREVAVLSDEEKLKLFCGKISIDDLDQIQEYQGRCTMEQITRYFLNS